MNMTSSVVRAMLLASLIAPAVPLYGAAITENDSTQPRGSPGGVSTQGRNLDPIITGFPAPAFYSYHPVPDKESDFYKNWVGSMMGNTARDPSVFATLNIANQDLIDYFNSLSATEKDAFRTKHKLTATEARNEDLLPVVADVCLRCHMPAGWLEGHSEPPTAAFPHLKGQFWGAAFLEESVTNPVNLLAESEAEMEGVQCAFCHRITSGQTRGSLFDGSSLMAGNGGFFVDQDAGPTIDIQDGSFTKTADMCGTCHDVTNPIIKTKTDVDVDGDGTREVPDMLHPMERTYSEWYWSGYRDTTGCKDCHKPMQFKGAQTWLLYPGIDSLWGAIDAKWTDIIGPIYDVPANGTRTAALRAAVATNRAFMKTAAKVQILGAPISAMPGGKVKVKVKVTNLTGHKLPTGFAEGRQMWIHLQARRGDGTLFWENGALDANGGLIDRDTVKVYEQEILAEGYPFVDAQAKDLNGDGDNTDADEIEKAQHFHFALMNKIIKDNRIPPKGYNKKAYQADGAFIIPENAYADGQNWDITQYTIDVPADVQGTIQITATLKYQTFNKEYAEFLRDHDNEPTVADGGRARNLPTGTPFALANPGVDNWGETLHKLWEDADQGLPVTMAAASRAISVVP
jgi:hypothetical protein